jgi:hypothetical protein
VRVGVDRHPEQLDTPLADALARAAPRHVAGELAR